MTTDPTPPSRPAVLELAGLDKPPMEYSLREAVEWMKRMVRIVPQEYGDLTPGEERAFTQSWGALVDGLAKREQIGPGAIAWFMHHLVTTELTLADTAAREYTAATAAVQAIAEEIA